MTTSPSERSQGAIARRTMRKVLHSDRIFPMSDAQVVAYLRAWAEDPPADPFCWPTDACGTRQHLRYVHWRNANWSRFEAATDRTAGLALLLEYADRLERGEIP